MNLEKLSLDALWIFLDSCSANPALKDRIEKEMQNRVPDTKKYSREYLYSVNIIGKKALIIYFIPESGSYKNFGRKIVINMVMDDEERVILSNNYTAKPAIRTQGKIKGDFLVIDDISEEQRKILKTKGFDTTDIMLCEWE
ncbi:MAG: hypothetical protein EOP53_01390 [Sphingobacteriales bacterium]|nr:MAG: hypothetical protein EOP53_01390 [Sphingobacteriales bacterium]